MLEYKRISVKSFISPNLRNCWSQQILFCSGNKEGIHSELLSIHVLISRPIKLCQPSLGGSWSGQTEHEICKLSEVGERSINICMNTLVQTLRSLTGTLQR